VLLEKSNRGAGMNPDELLKKYTAGERDFFLANLSGAKLQHANLRGADFTHANLAKLT
jgi:uncharacterized protein YjbI with pentapeptide repeats